MLGRLLYVLAGCLFFSMSLASVVTGGGQADTAQPKTESTVASVAASSGVSVSGRLAAGLYDSEEFGPYPSTSFETPEAKLRFSFKPNDIAEIVMRMNLNNAEFNGLDHFYLDTDLERLLNLPVPLGLRVGRMQVDFGEETWSNNPVENVLPSSSAADVAVYDEGLQLAGKLGGTRPLGYGVSVTNGSSGVGSDTTSAKAFTGKIAYNVLEPLRASASYYDSGSIEGAGSEMAVAGIVSAPGEALSWSRQAWELDLRYDVARGEVLDPPAYSDSKAIIRVAYGGFSDDGSGGLEREGQYGFVEGTYNLTEKFYLAGRASLIELDDAAVDLLNGILANEYKRYSIGLGYRLTANGILKVSYDWNDESGQGVTDLDNNLLAAVGAWRF